MAEARLREELKSMVVSIKRSRTCLEMPNNPEIIYFIGTILVAETQFCYVVVDSYMVKAGCSYEATLPDGSMVSLVVDQFKVVEKGEFATFYIDRSAVNYNVKMINAVEFGDQEVSRFTNIRVVDFYERQNIFFPRGRVVDKEDQDSFFMFDWFSKNIGTPVFHEAKALVGISYRRPSELSFAYTLSRVKDELLKLSEVPGQTFEEFLHQVTLRGSICCERRQWSPAQEDLQ